MLCTEQAARGIHPGLHGTTFGGGPLTCAVAVAVIDAMEQMQMLEHIQHVGNYFQEKLRGLEEKHQAVEEVRGLGLMLAIELNSAEMAKLAVAKMLERRILINRTSDTVLRFLPPYILGTNHVDTAIAALDAVFNEVAVLAPSV
jgi:acetylornithine aminotransferase/acetylornithine/N-succinyldiaminopimelate aminotransferase